MICGDLILEAGEVGEKFVSVMMMMIGWMREVAEGRERRTQVIITKEREFSGLGDQLFECRAEWLGWPAWSRHVRLVAPFTEAEEERRDANFWWMPKTSLAEFRTCHPSVLCGTGERMLTVSTYYGVYFSFTVSLPSAQPWRKHTVYLQFLSKSK